MTMEQESQVALEDDAKFQEMTAKAEKRQEFVAGLRELADWYETAPHWVTLPGAYYSPPRLIVYTDDGISPGDFARQLGHCEKRVSNTLFYLSRQFGPIVVDVVLGRETVCERKTAIEHI